MPTRDHDYREYTMKKHALNLLLTAAAGILILLALPGCGRPNHGDPEVATAMRLYEKRQFASAVPHLEKALQLPLRVYTQCEVLTMIGNCYNELEQYEKSLEYHDRAIAVDPNHHEAYVNKGVVCRLLGDYEEAGRLYARALELAPDYAELHASLGALSIHRGNYEASVKQLERAVQLDDGLAVAHSNLAFAYAAVGRFDDADKELKKAVVRGYHQADVIRERIEQFRRAAAGGN